MFTKTTHHNFYHECCLEFLNVYLTVQLVKYKLGAQAHMEMKVWMDDEWQGEGLRERGRDVRIIDGCLERHEEEGVMQVFFFFPE